MDTREAIANRIRQLCKERKITPNALSNISAVPQATVEKHPKRRKQKSGNSYNQKALRWTGNYAG